jgi:hypothetical protein
MSQSLATYPLLECVVSAAQFAAGEVAFYDAYAELIAADFEGSCTAPLRIDYDVLEHFRIVRAQCVMRLTLPHAAVRRWADQNGFASQLDACEAEAQPCVDGECDGEHQQQHSAKFGGAQAPDSAVLLLRLSSDDMANFLQSIAPLVASSRRTRSVSRISVTEPLPLYEATVDPAADVLQEMLTSDRCASDSSNDSTATTVPLSRNTDADTASRGAGYPEKRQEGKSPSSQKPAVPLGEQRKPLLDGSAAGETASLISAPLVLLGGDSPPSDPQSIPKQATATPRLATPRRTTPTRSAFDTLASVEAELAELLDDTEYPQIVGTAGNDDDDRRRRRRRAQPLKRPATALPTTSLPCAAVAQHDERRIRRRGDGSTTSLPLNNATDPSLCPSLLSSDTDGTSDCRRRRRAAPPQSTAGGTVAETKTAAKTHRLVVAHLCASATAPFIAAATPTVPPGSDVNAEETVGTVTALSSRALFSHDRSTTRRLRNPFQDDTVAEGKRDDDDVDNGAVVVVPQKRAERAAAATSAVNDDGDENAPRHRCGDSRAPLSPLRPSVPPQERKCTSPQSCPPSSSSSVRVGELLKQGRVYLAVNAENGIPPAERVAARSSANKPAATSIVEPHPDTAAVRTAEYDACRATHCDERCLVSHPLTSRTAQPSNAQLQRDVKSYILDLFPPSRASTRQRGSKRSARPSATATSAAAARSRRHGGPPKSPFVGVALTAQKPASAPRDKLHDTRTVPLRSRTNTTATAAAAGAQTKEGSQLRRSCKATHRSTRKRSRSGSSGSANSDERIREPSSPHRTESANAVAKKPDKAGCDRSAVQPTSVHKVGAASVAEKCASRVCDAAVFGLVQFQPTSPFTCASAAAASDLCQLRHQTREVLSGEAHDRHDCSVAASLKAQRAASTEAAATATGSVEREAADAVVTNPRQVPQPVKASSLKKVAAAVQPHPLPATTERCGGAAAAKGVSDVALGDSGEAASNSSSKATCPLFYCHDSRKERTRRLLRYMNVLSQNLAVMHETHDELRGLLLTMLNEQQL